MGTLLRNASWSGIELSSGLTDIGHFRRALELDSHCQSDLALAALADDCIESRDARQAFEFLERAAAMGTNIDGVYFKLAVFYQAMRGSRRGKQEAYRRAKDLAPTYGTRRRRQEQNPKYLRLRILTWNIDLWIISAGQKRPPKRRRYRTGNRNPPRIGLTMSVEPGAD